jgi:cytochrome c oxidase subunit 3
VVLVRALLGTYTEHNVVRVRVAAMFWHFVDAVWLLMFVSIYLF